MDDDSSSVNCLFSWERETRIQKLNIHKLNTSDCADVLYESVWQLFGIPPHLQSLRLNGRLVESPVLSSLCFSRKSPDVSQTHPSPLCSPHWTVVVSGRVVGGKGGFGTLLRGQKGGRKKTRNFDACRDLSGRRIRHSKAMERLTGWIEKRKKDDELVEALGGDLCPIRPPKRYTTDEDCVLGGKGLNEPSRYLDELDESLDKTVIAVQLGMRNEERFE